MALLLNDVTYLLDESLTKLADIHRLQHELETPDVPNKKELERQLASAEGQAQSYMGLGNETVYMVRLFTAAIPDAFVTGEIVNRLAGMLDYNLEAITGPKCSNLKVKDPQKYHFDAKKLLSEITAIYLNLGTRPDFVRAIARDGRSYRPAVFSKAYYLLARHVLKNNEELAQWHKLAEAIQGAKTMEEEDDEDLGEIPDEFSGILHSHHDVNIERYKLTIHPDPIMATLMENPVILPSSRAVVDIETIKSHLLSDSTDPFNRSPLKIEDVIPGMFFFISSLFYNYCHWYRLLC